MSESPAINGNGNMWKSLAGGIIKGGPVAIMLAVVLFHFAPKYIDKVVESFRQTIQRQNDLLAAQAAKREESIQILTGIIADNSKMIGTATEVIRRNDATLERATRHFERTP